jgi:hypothetical protein
MGRRRRRGGWSVALAAGLSMMGPVGTASAAPISTGAVLGSWRLQGHVDAPAAFADQGLASVSQPGGGTKLVLRGGLSIPIGLRLDGWSHVGDPGSWHGYLFDAYQSAEPDGEKLFAVTTPSGVRHDFVHDLVPGEAANNSFAAVSPDGQWLVSGEWGRMTRLLVFPTPMLNPAADRAATLPAAGSISLDRPVRDIQGCSFVTSTELLCSADDPSTELWPTPRQLLEVTLPHALTGAPTAAAVRSLGELPDSGACSGYYEVEGIDYQADSGVLRVDVLPPGVCGVASTVYEYHAAVAGSGHG